jgi:hypothetical protein
MKNFDTERRERNAKHEAQLGDRSFTLGGETFFYRPIVSYTVLEDLMDTDDLEGTDLVRGLEEGLVSLLEDGQEERFLAVLHSKTDPMTFHDLNELVKWVTEAQSGRPTLAPSPSMGGDATTSTSSTDDSSSKQAVESVA